MLSTTLRSYDVDPLAIIDDYNTILQCPRENDTVDEWNQWYKQVACYIHQFDLVANPHGIFRNPTKDKLLIHGHLKPPPPPPKDETFGIDLASIITFEGIIMAGSPIGTDEFMLNYVLTKVEAANEKTSKVAALCPDQVQLALAMISTGTSHSLDFLIRLTPTAPIVDALREFDSFTATTVMNIICPPEIMDRLPQRKVKLAYTLLSLSFKYNGLGLLPRIELGPMAFISSIVAASSDTQFRKYKAHLESHVLDAYNRYIRTTTLDVNRRSPVSLIIPDDHSKLLDTAHATRLKQTFHSQNGIMSTLTAFYEQTVLNQLKQSVLPGDDVEPS